MLLLRRSLIAALAAELKFSTKTAKPSVSGGVLMRRLVIGCKGARGGGEVSLRLDVELEGGVGLEIRLRFGGGLSSNDAFRLDIVHGARRRRQSRENR